MKPRARQHFSIDNEDDRNAAIRAATLLHERGWQLRREAELALAPDVAMWRTRRALTWLEMSGLARRSIYTDRYVLTDAGEDALALALVLVQGDEK